jgi:hypothetical protein
MRFRKLRIAWSVAWGVVTLLLCSPWVRSYVGGEYFYWIYAFRRSAVVGTAQGRVVVYSGEFTIGPESSRLQRLRESTFFVAVRDSVASPLLNSASYRPIRTAALSRGSALEDRAVVISLWLPVLVTAVLVAIAWRHWRFSLRTFLIATTAAAMALGLAVYGARR